MKKLHQITVRLGDEDMEYLVALARRLELPTDGRLNVSRAVQAVIRFMRTSVGLALPPGQGMQGMLRMPMGGAA